MSSINPHFTFEYVQPKEYRFSHDSVFFARKIFEFYAEKNISEFSVLDLCSGCGIIGLDFLFHLKHSTANLPKRMDFLEVQDIYQKYFEENVKRLGDVTTQLSWQNKNYDTLIGSPYQEKYDLIFCNPPYFFPTQGKLSPSDFKNRCRFFIDSTFLILVQAIVEVLSPQGSAYILLRSQQDHGWDELFSIQQILPQALKATKLDNIRGTAVVRIG